MEKQVQRVRIKTLLDMYTKHQYEVMTGNGNVKTTLSKIGGLRFGYFVQRNVDKLISEIKHQEQFRIELLRTIGNINEDYIKCEQELFNKYCLKDDKGNPVGNQFNINPDKIKEFEEERKEIEGRYPEDTKKNEEFTNKMQEYMEGMVTIDFYGIKKDELPEMVTAEIINFIIDNIII